MAEGQADREVLFILKAIASDDNDAAFKAFAEQASSVQKRITSTALSEEDKRATAAEKARDREQKAAERAADKELKAQQRASEQAHKAAEKQARERERAAAKEERTRVAEINRAKRLVEDAGSRIEAANVQMSEGFYKGLDGVVKLGEGFVKLGLAGEDDLKKLAQGLVKLRGAADSIRGAIDLWRGITEAVKGYRAAVVAATAAEEAAVIVRAKSTATAGASAIAGGGAATAGAGGTAAVSALGASAMGTAASIAALGTAVAGAASAIALMTPQGQRFAYERMARSSTMEPGGWGAGAARLQARGRWMLARIGTLGLADEWAERDERELLAAQAGAKSARERAGRIAQAGELARLRADLTGRETEADLTAQSRIAEARRATGEAAYRRALESTTSPAEKSRVAEIHEARARREAEIARENAARLTGERERMGMTYGADRPTPESMARITAQLADADESAIAASRRSITAAEERLRVEKEIAAERITAADQAIDKAQSEISLRKQLIETERERLMSAEERFGQLDTREQERLKQLMIRARQGDNLTTEEWKSLQQVGTRRAAELATQAFRTRAQQAGFGQVFGAEERQRIGRYQREQQRLQVDLRTQRDLKVKIEADQESLAKRIGGYIAGEMDRLEGQLVEQIARETRAAKDAMRSEFQDRQRQLQEANRDRLESGSRAARR